MTESSPGPPSFPESGADVVWHQHFIATDAITSGFSSFAYFAIAGAIAFFLSQRRDVEYFRLGVVFSLLVVLCGATQLANLVLIWRPAYRLEGLLRTSEAMTSVAAALALWALLPRILAHPTRSELARKNEELKAEILRRAAAEAALAEARDEQERRVASRTAELAAANRRLEAEVTERRRAEELARRSETRLRLVAESLQLAVKATALGIWDVDLASGQRRWSVEQKAILGLPQEAEADYERFAALIHPEDREWVIERYRRAHEPASGGCYGAEFRILRAGDGAERWVEATGQVYFDHDGRPTRAVGTLADVTVRRAAIEGLKESEERYRALIDTSPDAVFVHRDGIIMLANREAVARFGATSSADLIGRPVFSLVAQDSLSLAQERTAGLRSAGARAELAELTYRRLDGTPFTVEAAAAAVSIEGRLVIQVVFRDVTARKRVETALQARTAELETVLETVPIAVWLAHDPQARRSR